MKTASNSRIRRTIPLLLIVLLFCPFAHGKLIHVDDDGQADFDSIQAGIDNAEIGDTVLVMPGEYVITVPITFRGKAITVKSEAGPDETTIRMGTPADPNRGSVVLFGSNETADSVLDGFTITRGRGSGLQDALHGGGILFDASSATVRNCAIVQNGATRGGGVFCGYSPSPTLIDCIIAENSSIRSCGGVYSIWESSLTLTNCIITKNSSAQSDGGGLYAYSGASLTLTNCIITKNSSAQSGGGVMCWDNSLATLTNCIILENSAYKHSGVLCGDRSSMTLSNCTIAKNSTDYGEGGVMCARSSSMIMTNCTITGNSSSSGWGAVLCQENSSLTVTNSIVWGNTAPPGGQIMVQKGGEITISYSNVSGRQAGPPIEDGTIKWGIGNIDADPLFAEPGYWADVNDPNVVVEPDDPDAVWIDGDYHLKSEAGRWDPNSERWVVDDVTSPCIDRGDPTSPVGDEPDPNGGIINMGAYGGTPQASMSIGTPLPLPPLAHWKLDEVEGIIAHDSVGDSDATIVGAPLWQPDGGHLDGALELTGTTFIMAGFVLNPADGPFSLFAWVKGGLPGQGIITQQGGVDWLMADAVEGKLATELSPTMCSEAVITDGDWHRIGVTWDGSACLLYVDDVVEAQSEEDALAGSAGGVVIGCRKTMMPGTFWSGLIDDVRIYNRVVKP